MTNLQSIHFKLSIVVCMFFFTSCDKDSNIVQMEDNDIQEYITEPKAFGAIPEDPQTYAMYPQANIESLASLISENEVETRSSYRRINTPPVANQGNEGSCTVFASAYTISSYYTRVFAGKPYTNQGANRSPEYVYNSTKSAGACDKAGANMPNVLNFIKAKGVCSWSDMPYSDNNGCSIKPNSYHLNEGGIAKILSWSTVARNVSSVKTLLDKGYPVILVFDANSNFDKQALKMPAIYSSYKKTSDTGWHAVTIVGYDDQKQCFIVQNSWGTYWHDKGIFYIKYALFPTIATELYIMNPIFPKDIKVRNVTTKDVKVRMNSVEYTIKKGESKVLTSYVKGNDFDIWQCKVLCDWYGDYDPTQGKNYKIVAEGSKNYLYLVSE